MTTARRISLTLVVALGLSWSMLLAFGGVWLIGVGHALWGESGAQISRAAGAVGVLAGVLVFFICVADKVFPRTNRALVLAAEIPLSLLLFAGIGVMVWTAW